MNEPKPPNPPKVPEVSVNVAATVNVRIHVGNWPGSTNFNDLYRQVSREARLKIEHIMDGQGAVVGEPVISIHTIERAS